MRRTGERLIGGAVKLRFAQLLLKNNTDEIELSAAPVSSTIRDSIYVNVRAKIAGRTFSICPSAHRLLANRTCRDAEGVRGTSLIPIIPDPSAGRSTINGEGRPHRGGLPKGISNLSALAPRWRFEEKPVGGLRPIRQR